MPLSRVTKKKVMKHLLETVFALDPDSSIELAFKENAINEPHDFIQSSDAEIEVLEYTKGNELKLLPKGHILVN